MLPKLQPIPVYYIRGVIYSLSFAIYATFSMVYMVEDVGLNPFQLVLVGTVLEGAVFIFEVPTGIVADVYSRRLSIIIGMVLIGAGLALTGLFTLFGTVLLAQVIWGMGYTFTSGATQAWLVDEIGEQQAGPVFIRSSQLGLAAGLVGIGISMVLVHGGVRVPVVTGGAIFFVLALFLVLFMPETNFKPATQEGHNPFVAMRRTFMEGVRAVRGRSILMMFLAVEIVVGAFGEGVDRLNTAHFLEYFRFPALGDLDTVTWFGIISAVGMVLSIIATEVARRRLDQNDERAVARTLMLLYGGVSAGVLIFALAGNFGVAVTAFWGSMTLRRTTYPLMDTWINQHIPSQVRATVLSMAGQMNAVGQMTVGPLIGLVGTAFSLRAALVASSVLLTPVLWLFGRTLRKRDVVEPEPIPA